MSNLLLVMLGGGLGAVVRAAVTNSCSKLSTQLPVATLIVNLVGSFLISLLSGIAIAQAWLSPLIIVGFLGGLTTFSTLSLELTNMLTTKSQRMLFIAYSFLQYGLCFIACLIGYVIV
ncbi:fluoride efflux transporter FluC [Staphylococcus simulans]|uniref:fluoride efflux transporter FluC n=1 Tax=Staphylococcus simulans TaxID=1286 RepID=UPI000D1EB194|nr:CrcB family protein [Staphylococcus simulans]PTJ90232.1 camphor resistance protein CrcB [Staphylococcus simulans]UXR33800.1 CrcB family protein [Staphylococcus simulans]UXR46191.1 CrcB family protein [Staphylococcus simulans]UXV41504.1 CrcB family protein [Staphylococcus simulans]